MTVTNCILLLRAMVETTQEYNIPVGCCWGRFGLSLFLHPFLSSLVNPFRVHFFSKELSQIF